MESIRVFLDTDVLINWLAKEVDPNTGKKLWEKPYKILKMIEKGKISGTTSLINLMEIIFVLRRKKRWRDEDISFQSWHDSGDARLCGTDSNGS